MGATTGQTAIVREVGPRDGLQMAKTILPTDLKLKWIGAMADAGLREMEVTSFVPRSAMPQMADAAEVTREARSRYPNLLVVTLAPNLRGAQKLMAPMVGKSMRNQVAALDDLKRVLES